MRAEFHALLLWRRIDALTFRMATGSDTFLETLPATAFAGFSLGCLLGCKEHSENSIEGGGREQQ